MCSFGHVFVVPGDARRTPPRRRAGRRASGSRRRRRPPPRARRRRPAESARIRRDWPSAIAAWWVIRASCPAPTIPTTGSPVRASTMAELRAARNRYGAGSRLAGMTARPPRTPLRAYVRASWRILLKETQRLRAGRRPWRFVIDLGPVHRCSLGFGALKAKIVSATVSTTFAYFGNRYLSFSHRARTDHRPRDRILLRHQRDHAGLLRLRASRCSSIRCTTATRARWCTSSTW